MSTKSVQLYSKLSSLTFGYKMHARQIVRVTSSPCKQASPVLIEMNKLYNKFEIEIKLHITQFSNMEFEVAGFASNLNRQLIGEKQPISCKSPKPV